METFKKIKLEDLESFIPYFENQDTKLCDYAIATRYLWSDFFGCEYLIHNETLIFKVNYHQDTWFEYPLGKDEEGALDFIESYCLENKLSLVFGTLPLSFMKTLKQRYPNSQLMFDRNWCDYLYEYESFASHKGKAYNKKRNHIKQFEKNYPNHHFERITESNIDQVKAFYDRHFKETIFESSVEQEEAIQVYRALENYQQLHLIGGALFVENQCVGFSLGEIVKDTLIHHIEKADTSYVGCYQKLVYEFLQLFKDSNIKYVNREEDDGNLGLRKSKFSYRPCRLLNKYTLFIKKQDVKIHLVSLKKLSRIE